MFKFQSRTSLVIYVSSLRQVRQLKRYGHVDYISKRMRYVIIYMNNEVVEESISCLKQLNFVRRIVRSPRNQLERIMNLDHVISNYSKKLSGEED